MPENIEQKQLLSAILRCDLFSNLLLEEEESVIARTELMLLRKGDLLFSPGKKAEHLYLLLEGGIRVFLPQEGGGDNEIARFTPGDIIGDFDFARGAEYDARAEALEESSLVVFPGYGLNMDSFFLESPHIVAKILLNSITMVTGRIKASRKLIIENAAWVQELHRKVYEDPLTGLWQQGLINDEINRILEDPMALIMLKPDRFKILVDGTGHDVGDEAMIRIAGILKNCTRKLGRGWAMRFKSNETGILVNKCDAVLAESLARSVFEAVAALPPVPMGQAHGQEGDVFTFSGSMAWGIWPVDDKSWDSLFTRTYELLMDTWKAGGNRIVRCGLGRHT